MDDINLYRRSNTAALTTICGSIRLYTVKTVRLCGSCIFIVLVLCLIYPVLPACTTLRLLETFICQSINIHVLIYVLVTHTHLGPNCPFEDIFYMELKLYIHTKYDSECIRYFILS